MKWACMISAVLFLLGCTILQAGEMRQWTGSNGKVIEVEFLGLDGDVVKIKLKDGREMNVLLSKFSKADQEYAQKAGATDDPFAETAAVAPRQGNYPEVLRVTLDIAEDGNAKVRLEKANAPPTDDFGGKRVKTALLPDTEIITKDGLTKMIYDYRRPSRFMFFQISNVGPDPKTGYLMFPPQNDFKAALLGFPNNYIHFPLQVRFDVAVIAGQCCNMEWLFDNQGPMMSFRVFCSGNKVNDKFNVDFRFGDDNPEEGGVKEGRVYFRPLLDEKNVDLRHPMEKTFNIPLPNEAVFRCSIGKGMMSQAHEQDMATIGLARFEITARMTPRLAIDVQKQTETGGIHEAVVISKVQQLSEKCGIRPGSKLASINGQPIKSLGDAERLLDEFTFDKRYVVTIKEGGHEKEVVFVE